MHIHNTTFVCADRDLPALLGLLRSKVIPRLNTPEHVADLRLSRVVSALPGADEAESIALQFEFDKAADVAAWKKKHLPGALALVSDEFGDKVLMFSTLMQKLDHE